VVLNFEGTSATTRELERFFKINDEVIRYLLVRQDEEVAARIRARSEAARARRKERETQTAQGKPEEAVRADSGAEADSGEQQAGQAEQPE